jgi:hypothetical protein
MHVAGETATILLVRCTDLSPAPLVR